MSRMLAAACVVALSGCGYFMSPPATDPQLRGAITCVMAHRSHLDILCCPDASGKQKCFLTTGGYDI